MKPDIRTSCAAAAALFLLLHSLPAETADDTAAALAAKAERIIDRWDGDAKALEEARAAIEESVRLDPASSHARGVQARQILLAGTTEEGIRPSALGAAHGILFRAALELQPPDARVFAFLARVRADLKQDDKIWWALNSAEKADPNDPWGKLAWSEYYARMGDKGGEMRYAEEAIAAGLASPPELRKVYDMLLYQYAGLRRREKADAAYRGRAAIDPKDAMIPDAHARNLVVWFQDFPAAERLAREALAISDIPHARQTLSLALYGEWAQAARDGKGIDVTEPLFRKAQAFDPGGHMLPTCLANWKPLEFVYTRLEEKRIRLEDMHQC